MSRSRDVSILTVIALCLLCTAGAWAVPAASDGAADLAPVSDRPAAASAKLGPGPVNRGGAKVPLLRFPHQLGDAPQVVLHDNGPLVTHPGGGFGGADASALQTALTMNILGFGHQIVNNNRVADDFTISDPGGWQIDTITFFAYQTGSTTTSTINDIRLQIWDGPPGAGGVVVFGDLVTNRLASSSFTNAYRVTDTTLTANNRPIMADVATVGITLGPGTYWLDWMTGGTLASGPWAPPVTVLGSTGTGNGMQSLAGGAFAPVLDVGPQDFPFVIEGSAVAQIALNKTVGTVPGVCAGTDAITVTTGTSVYYCFTVTNNSAETFEFHDLVDDHLGTLLTNFPLTLTPGASAELIAPDVATATVTNTGTWTAATALPGYTIDDTIAVNFEDISGTGTAVPLTDDSVSPALPMGFTFNFFGADYTDAYISSNGFMTFLAGQPNGCCTGAPIPTAATPNAIVAGWWEDLNPGAGGAVHYQTLGVAPNRRFVAQFTNVPHFGGGNLVTMQFKLFEGSNVVEVHYQAAPADGGQHSAGVENETGAVGNQWVLQTTGLPTPIAVRYSIGAPPVEASASDTATVTIADPNIVVSPPSLTSLQGAGTQVTLPLDIQNTGVADLDWTIDEAAPFADAPRGTGTFLNQAPNQVNGLFADSTCERCGTGQQSIAENFTLAAPATIGQITFWGGYFNTDTPLATDVLRVLVHADASGLPGAVVYDESNVASTRVQTGVILFGVHEWEFTLTLAAPVNLTPGTYWVEIFNNTAGNPDDFFWETGNLDPTHGLAGSGWTTATPGVAWNFDGATDLAIQIDGPASPCYTPSDVPWLSVSPLAGTTLPAATDTVDVTLDSTGLTPGAVYDALVCVLSNDPDTSLVEVPVTLTVDSMPFFGDFEEGNTSDWTLQVP
ncbi:MAG: hypothetical protein F9K18_06010 [Thermoanaerobaculia bacterium]|nr:MAG: hypothetical protein F9K18_06010 [Thermoanaerobaculia bacterium]